jgi:UPF0755 protein
MTDEEDITAPSEAAGPPTPPGRRRAAPVVAAVLALAVLLLSVAVWGLFLRPASSAAAGRNVEVEIPMGSDTRAIGAKLAAAAVVPSANMFRLRSRLDAADGRFKAGIYHFTTGMDYESVISRLEEGPPVAYYTLPIPEGFTIAQISLRVQARTGIPAAEFRRLATTAEGVATFKPKFGFLAGGHASTLEGYLFPKTYGVKKGSTAAEVIGMMLEQFGKESASLDLAQARAHGLTLYQVVTIASIIEREAVVAKQQRLVSSVVYNRLQRNMYLGLDSVLGYVLGQKVRLSLADIRIDSPYNTYRNKGLPPTPIANPGLSTLRAAAQPANTRYLYFVGTSKDGSLTFTETYADFLKAKAISKTVLGQ